MDSIVVSHFWNVLIVSLCKARHKLEFPLLFKGVEERNDIVDVAEPKEELPGDREAVVEDEKDADLRRGLLLLISSPSIVCSFLSSSSSVMSRLSVCVPWSAN